MKACLHARTCCEQERGGYQERNQVEILEFTVEALVRGYHVYQTVWEVRIGEVLPCTREPGNRHDPHTVAVKKGDIVVGHLSRKIPCLYSIFIR